MIRSSKSMVLLLAIIMILSCTRQKDQIDSKNLNNFIKSHLAKIEPLQREAALAYWEAATTGNKEIVVSE